MRSRMFQHYQFFKCLVILGVCATISGCGGGGGAPPGSTTCPGYGTILVAPVNPRLPVGLTQQFTAAAAFPDGTNSDLTAASTWNSSNPSVATVSSSGLATAVAAGTTTITATYGGVTASTTLTVTSATLSSISVTPANPSIPEGVSQQFTATGTYSDASQFDITAHVTWSSSNLSVVATVSGGGMTSAVIGAGATNITATLGIVSGFTTLTGTLVTLTSIAVTPANPSLPVGLTQQFTATGTYSDATTHDITTHVTWNSSVTSVATVNSSGIATGVAMAGTTNITAAYEGVTGSTTLTGQGPVLTAITVTVAWPTSCSFPCTAQATATGTYSDTSTANITTQVTWSVPSGSATVSSTGLATISGDCLVVIKASIGNIYGEEIGSYPPPVSS